MSRSDASLPIGNIFETERDKYLAVGHFPEMGFLHPMQKGKPGPKQQIIFRNSTKLSTNAIIAISSLLEVASNVGCSKKLRTPLLWL